MHVMKKHFGESNGKGTNDHWANVPSQPILLQDLDAFVPHRQLKPGICHTGAPLGKSRLKRGQPTVDSVTRRHEPPIFGWDTLYLCVLRRYMTQTWLYLCLGWRNDTMLPVHTSKSLLFLCKGVQSTKRQFEEISSRRRFFNWVLHALVANKGSIRLQVQENIYLTAWQYVRCVTVALCVQTSLTCFDDTRRSVWEVQDFRIGVLRGRHMR